MDRRGLDSGVFALPTAHAQAARIDEEVKPTAAQRFHISADSLGLPALRMWNPSSDNSAYLTMWDDKGQDGPEHQELILPLTPNSVHIMNGHGHAHAGLGESAGPGSARTAMHHDLGSLSVPHDFVATPRSGPLMLLPGDFDHQFTNPQGLLEAMPMHVPSPLGMHHSMPLPTLKNLGFDPLPAQAPSQRQPQPQAHQASTGQSFARRYSQPALSADRRSPAASPSDSPSDEDAKPSRKRRRGGKRQTCSNCATHQTPQWRCGPYGPRTLCNACGVRFKKGLPMDGIIAARAASSAAAPAAQAAADL